MIQDKPGHVLRSFALDHSWTPFNQRPSDSRNCCRTREESLKPCQEIIFSSTLFFLMDQSFSQHCRATKCAHVGDERCTHWGKEQHSFLSVLSQSHHWPPQHRQPRKWSFSGWHPQSRACNPRVLLDSGATWKRVWNEENCSWSRRCHLWTFSNTLLSTIVGQKRSTTTFRQRSRNQRQILHHCKVDPCQTLSYLCRSSQARILTAHIDFCRANQQLWQPAVENPQFHQKELRASVWQETPFPWHVKLIDAHLDHEHSVLPVQMSEVINKLFRVTQGMGKCHFNLHTKMMCQPCRQTCPHVRYSRMNTSESHLSRAFRCFAQWPDLTDRCSTITPLRRQNSGFCSFSVQLSNTLGNDTVGLHHPREPQIQEVRLLLRPWNQRRNRYIPGLTVTNEAKSWFLVVWQQRPTTITHASQNPANHRSSVDMGSRTLTSGTVLLQNWKHSTLETVWPARERGTRKLIEHCSTLIRHTERQRFRYFL